MTKYLKQALYDLFQECARQGPDNTGYLHYIDQYTVSVAQHEFEKECRKHGDLKWVIQRQPAPVLCPPKPPEVL